MSGAGRVRYREKETVRGWAHDESEQVEIDINQQYEI